MTPSSLATKPRKGLAVEIPKKSASKKADTQPLSGLAAKTMTANGATKTTKDVDGPKKGFMDIPPELRLEVYRHYFTEDPPKHKHPPFPEDIHCCTCPDGRSECVNDNDCRAVCSCTGGSRTQLLRVSKLVHKEALEVFHDVVEVRLTMPEHQDDDMLPPDEGSLPEVSAQIPATVGNKIKNILLVSSTFKIQCRVSFDESIIDALPKYWPTLIRTFPNVEHVRLHLDWTHCLSDNGHGFDFDAFAGLAAFPKLDSVLVEISKCRYDYVESQHEYAEGDDWGHLKISKEMRENMAAVLRSEVKKLGKAAKIIEAEQRKMWWMVDGRESFYLREDLVKSQ